MQDMRLVCTLDGSEYKEYELLINEQPLGIISWKSEHDPSKGSWYTTAIDGRPRYFQTQAEVIKFLEDNPLKSASALSAKLKAEANKLIDLAEEIEAERTAPETQNQQLITRYGTGGVGYSTGRTMAGVVVSFGWKIAWSSTLR